MQYPSRVGVLLAGALCLAVEASAQSLVREAESCSIALTSAGQGAWRGVFAFSATVDATGRAGTVVAIKTEYFEAAKGFLRLDQFESCMARWLFATPGAVQIVLEAGTTGDALHRWVVTVSRSQERFRLVLPRTVQ